MSTTNNRACRRRLAEEQLGRITLEGAERVLDVGCGDGKITAEIAARVPRGWVLGVDPSQNMIAFASNHFGMPAHPNLRFEVADVRRLTYRGEFDRVVSFNTLHWVPQQGDALRSIHAALKPAGQALLRLVPEGRRKCLEDLIEDVRRSPRWAGYFTNFQKPYTHFTPEEYRGLAERNGFRVLRTGLEDRAWDFQTARPLSRSARLRLSNGHGTWARATGRPSSTMCLTAIVPWRRTASKRRTPSNSIRWKSRSNPLDALHPGSTC